MDTTDEPITLEKRDFLESIGCSCYWWEIRLGRSYNSYVEVVGDFTVSNGEEIAFYEKEAAVKLRDSLNEYLDGYDRLQEIADERNSKKAQPESV